MIVLNPFLDSVCNFGFKNIDLPTGINFEWFPGPQTQWLCQLPNWYYFEINAKRCTFFNNLMNRVLFTFHPFFKYLYSSLDNFVQYTSLCKWKINWAQNIRTSCFVCFCFDSNYFWGLQACYCVIIFFKREQSQARAFSFNRVSISVCLFFCLFWGYTVNMGGRRTK